MDESSASDTPPHYRIFEWLRSKGPGGLVVMNLPYVYFATAARTIARELAGISSDEAQSALHALDGKGLLDFTLHRRRGTRMILLAKEAPGEESAGALAEIEPDPSEHERERLVAALGALCERVRTTRPASARAIVRMTEQTIADLRSCPIEHERVGALVTGIGFGAASVPGIREAWENVTAAARAFGLQVQLYEMQRTFE